MLQIICKVVTGDVTELIFHASILEFCDDVIGIVILFSKMFIGPFLNKYYFEGPLLNLILDLFTECTFVLSGLLYEIGS